ncbi:PTS sugar transporter subunit IIA [Enterococcus pallens]|nr:fructose PTS transporter subunit IIA [Enterococcus pallens]
MEKNIGAILNEKTFFLDIAPFNDKDEMFVQLTRWYFEAGLITNKEVFKQALYEREALGSTYMGNEIALPHAKSSVVKRPAVLFCRMREPFLYESSGETGLVRFIFMLAVSQEQSGEAYIQMLASLAGLLANDEFLQKLRSLETLQEFLKYARDLADEEREYT